MRFFIALEIPEESKAQLKEVQQRLKQLIPQIRLTDNDKLHLTLAFVGEQPDSLKEPLIKVLQDSAVGVPSFEITPAYLDGFPNIHHPHTLWIGVKGDVDKLLLLREKIRDGLVSLKLLVDERRFTPHIAIGKITNFKIPPELEAHLEELVAIHFDPIQIGSIKLFESIPEEGFHTHNTLAEVKLSL